jgi:RNA polymerase sigma-70 factor (ECF subfamily)
MDDTAGRDLVPGLRDGAPGAWRAFHDLFAERVWRGVARRLGSVTGVADVVQETMLAAARSVRSFDESRGELWPWLWGIAVNQIALHHRREERHRRIERPEVCVRWFEGRDNAAVNEVELADLAAAVRATLADLPEDARSVLAAKYLDGDAVEAIAARTGCTGEAVRSRLARARAAFRRAFDACDERVKEACHD